MDAWGNLLVAGGIIVGIWIIWKLIGAVLHVSLSAQDRRFRESAVGIAIREVGERSGRNDGSVAAKRQAALMFADLLKHSPFTFAAEDITFGEAVEAYELVARASQFPIAVEAAYAVTGAARYEEIKDWATSNEVTSMASAFYALYPKWAPKHRTGSLEVAKLERGRWAMMMHLLEKRAEREGLLAVQ